MLGTTTPRVSSVKRVWHLVQGESSRFPPVPVSSLQADSISVYNYIPRARNTVCASQVLPDLKTPRAGTHVIPNSLSGQASALITPEILGKEEEHPFPCPKPF